MHNEELYQLLSVIAQQDICADEEIKEQLKKYILKKLKELNGEQ